VNMHHFHGHLLILPPGLAN